MNAQNIQICSISVNLFQICSFQFQTNNEPNNSPEVIIFPSMTSTHPVLDVRDRRIIPEDDEIPYNLFKPERHVL